MIIATVGVLIGLMAIALIRAEQHVERILREEHER